MNPRKLKQKIAERAEQNAKLLHWKLEGACLLYAMAVVDFLSAEGVYTILQAGTCLWRCLPRDQDDGDAQTLTHFGYDWKNNDPVITKQRLSMGMLPEMHVWAACPGESLLIDAATRHFPGQCKQLTGMEWRSPRPPDCLWVETNKGKWEVDAIYHPEFFACGITVAIEKRTRLVLEALGA